MNISFRIIIYLLIALQLIGCATTHPGKKGLTELNNNKVPLIVSAEDVTENKNESYELIYVTFENKSDSWVRIDEIDVPIESENADKVSVVVGKDLKDWANAVEEREKVNKHNKDVAIAAVGLAGAVATVATSSSSSSSNTAIHAGGIIATTGAMAYAVGDTISTSKSMANSPKKVPENHIYNSFAIPGKSFVRKWVLLNKPTSEIVSKIILNLKTVDGERERYVIKL